MADLRMAPAPREHSNEPAARAHDRRAPDAAGFVCPQWHDLASAVQRKSAAPQPLAATGSGVTGGLPGKLRAGVEALSGTSMSDVRVHTDSPEPARRDALAYTRGSDIHIGPGQGQHLAHEAWHVVQQKQGRVQATEQFKGEPLNTDVALEHEADVMGARAARWSGPAAPDPPSPGADAPVVQRRGAPVIQARKVPLHHDARCPDLGRGDTYTVEEQEDGSTRRFVELDLDKYPHIKESALDNYEEAVTADPVKFLSSAIYEDIAEGGKAYVFADSESTSLYSIHLSAGDEVITMTPRNPNPMTGRSIKAQSILNATGTPKMGEADAQHVGTHYPGTPGGGTHQHFVGTGGKINLAVVSRLIDRLEDEGIIGAPKVSNSGKPLTSRQIDPTMADSAAVGASVREALGVPERTTERATPDDLKGRFSEEVRLAEEAKKERERKAKLKEKPKSED